MKSHFLLFLYLSFDPLSTADSPEPDKQPLVRLNFFVLFHDTIDTQSTNIRCWNAALSYQLKPLHEKKAADSLDCLHGADDEARTRYLHLGKVALYQMSYIRISLSLS